jgi:tetratricopeptide (TPR) repeat protein
LRRQLAGRYPHNLEYQENLAAGFNNLGSYLRDLKQYGQAEKAFRQGVAIREKLVKENCQVVQFQKGLGSSYYNLGTMYYNQVLQAAGAARDQLFAKGKESLQRAVDIYKRLHDEHPEENRLRVDYAIYLSAMGNLLYEDTKALALPWYDKAIPYLEEALKEGDQAAVVRRSLANAYWGRAEVHTAVRQFAQAVADWDRALELDDGSNKKDWQDRRSQARLDMARHLAADGLHEKAAAAVEDLWKDPATPQRRVDAARVLALCAVVANEGKHSAPADSYAARAVALLRLAYQEGYFKDNPRATVLGVFQDIGPIARRADFQKLVKEIRPK